MSIFDALRARGAVIEACGSRVTCDPAPTDTDEDWLVVLPALEKTVSDAVGDLVEADFNMEGDGEHYQRLSASSFMSWRKDRVNLIVTSSPDFAARHRAATHVCKKLNLLDKADRIMVFQAVLYGAQA